MKITVHFTTRFEALHLWKDAPSAVEFLRHPHRHVFHMRGELVVGHADRDVEFILLKREVEGWLAETLDAGCAVHAMDCDMDEDCTCWLAGADLPEDVERWSCEHWAIAAGLRFGLSACEVSEDGENGARVEF